MERGQKISFILGILVIVIAAAGIVMVSMQFFKGGGEALTENGQETSAPEVTQAATESTATATPSPTPEPTATPIPEPVVDEPVKGLYLTPNTVNSPTSRQRYAELADRTEINTYVIDIKDDLGEICYETQVPLAVKHNAWGKKYDVKEVIKTFHEHGIRVIGRIVCFSDPYMPLKEPELSLKNADGSVFKVPLGNSHLAWLDPSNEQAWQYIVDISKEAVELGFDELQYDYIRFPETTNFKYDMSYLEKEKSEYINDFIQAAREQLPGVILSADIFGSICLQSQDLGGLGQTLEAIGERVHYISPMIYPSHFANSSTTHYSGNGHGTNINGVLYPKPDMEPYKVIYNTLLITKSRLEKADSDVKVRPYLQGFTADTYNLPEGYYMTYGEQQYRDQIQAVYDAGYAEWIFWNSRNTYVEKAFLPK